MLRDLHDAERSLSRVSEAWRRAARVHLGAPCSKTVGGGRPPPRSSPPHRTWTPRQRIPNCFASWCSGSTTRASREPRRRFPSPDHAYETRTDAAFETTALHVRSAVRLPRLHRRLHGADRRAAVGRTPRGARRTGPGGDMPEAHPHRQAPYHLAEWVCQTARTETTHTKGRTRHEAYRVTAPATAPRTAGTRRNFGHHA